MTASEHYAGETVAARLMYRYYQNQRPTKKPTYELIYFDVRGRAELARCVFVAAGQEFKDTRLTQQQWTAMKGETQYEQLPELRIDGKVLSQCNSIARFLAREFSLAGKDNYENGRTDMYVDMCNELLQVFVFTMFVKDEAVRKEQQQKLKDDAIPKFLGNIERDLDRNGGKYLIGNALTLADLAVQDLLDVMFQHAATIVLKKYPKIREQKENLLSLPNIGDYLKNRTAKLM